MRLFRDDLQVRDARPAAGAPVDQGFGAVGQALAVQAQERLAHGPRRDLVHREAQPAHVQRGADAPLLAQDRLARLADELPHRLEVLLAAQGWRGSRPRLARILSSTYWAAIEAWSSPGRKSAGRPCIRAWRVIRSSTVERWAWPRCSEPVTLGGGWMMTKGGLRPIGARTLAVRVEDVGGYPALEDVVLDLARLVGLGHLRRVIASPPPSRSINETTRSPSGRTGRGTTCWFGFARRRSSRRPDRIAAGRSPLGALSGASRTARELRSRRSDCGAFSLAPAEPGPALCSPAGGATPLGRRREAAIVAQGQRRAGTGHGRPTQPLPSSRRPCYCSSSPAAAGS